MDEASARAIHTWRYAPPYDVYNGAGDVGAFVQTLLDPRNAYHTIRDVRGSLIAYCCFGPDARVPGGDYDEDTLDVGLGMRPDLTGQGRGPGMLVAILDFARRTFAPPALRVTVAAFNQRAQKVYQKAGFRVIQEFTRSDGMPFVIMMRPAAA
jgi:RimJ/RimL family protein N-acetyltransferase